MVGGVHLWLNKVVTVNSTVSVSSPIPRGLRCSAPDESGWSAAARDVLDSPAVSRHRGGGASPTDAAVVHPYASRCGYVSVRGHLGGVGQRGGADVRVSFCRRAHKEHSVEPPVLHRPWGDHRGAGGA
eukprot:9435899-Pyramimonas_sp.AAC.1